MMPEATPLVAGLFVAAVLGILICGVFIARRKPNTFNQTPEDVAKAIDEGRE